jgi:hypothetical protein
MVDSHDLQVMIILVLIPLVIVGMHYLLDARDAAKRIWLLTNRRSNANQHRR